MPRISIIVAHQNDQRLEDTLLSVLENRPRDSEIIVAHDGSYSDPYHLEDEVLFVETEQGATRANKLNEALYATCAPVVHILGEGTLVTDGWCEGAIHRIQKQQITAVAPLIKTRSARSTTCAGLDGKLLARRGLKTVRSNLPSRCAGPVLAAGFFSRRTLLSLGGLLESVDSQLADVDLALCFQNLGLVCEVDSESTVLAPESVLLAHQDAGVTRDLASLLTAHGQIAAGIASGVKGAAGRLLSNALNPSQWAPAIAWGIGLANNRLAAPVSERLSAATRAQEMQGQSTSTTLNIFRQGATEIRKAA